MSNKQPEALRLAERLERYSNVDRPAISAELRRLHALNAELLEALITADRTFAENGLLACHAARQEIRAAIAKAEAAQ